MHGSWPSLIIRIGLIILKNITIIKLTMYIGKLNKYLKNNNTFDNKVFIPPLLISVSCFFIKFIIINLSFSKETAFYLGFSNCFHIFVLNKILD